MSKKLIAGLLAVLALVGAGAWYFLSPGYAMMQLRDAAIEGDAEALNERIDFPSVRDGLKADLRAHLTAELAKQEEADGLGAFGAMLAMSMVDGIIDGIITPESMEVMIKQGRLQRGASKADAEKPAEVEWNVERAGLSRFTATPTVPEGEKAPGLVFERDGLGWKLAKIEIPDGGLGGGAN